MPAEATLKNQHAMVVTVDGSKARVTVTDIIGDEVADEVRELVEEEFSEVRIDE